MKKETYTITIKVTDTNGTYGDSLTLEHYFEDLLGIVCRSMDIVPTALNVKVNY